MATDKLSDRIVADTTYDPGDRLLTQAEAAELLTVAPQTLSVWRSSKRYDLPYSKIGRAVRYRHSDVMAFIESRIHSGVE